MRRTAYINEAVQQVSAVGRDIVDGSVAGSTNDAVLRFNAANDVVVGTGIAINHDAVNGDSVAITRPGVFGVSFQFSQAAATTVNLGIGLGVTGVALTGNPTLANAGTLLAVEEVRPAANTGYAVLSTVVVVSKAAAYAVGGALIRFLGTNGAGAVIPDATILDNTECGFRVVQLARLV